MQRFTRAAMAALLAGAMALSVTACGGDDEPSAAGATGAATSAAGTGGDLQATAKAKVEGFMAEPVKWPGPDQPFDPGQGKAMVLTCGLAADGCAVNGKEAVAALKALGWQTGGVMDGQFSPQKQAAYLDQAVQQKLDAVVLVSIDVSTIKAAVDRALKAGVQVACSLCDSGAAYADKVIDTRVDYTKQGNQIAWAVLARSGKDAKVVHFVDNAYDAVRKRLQGFKETFEAECPDCEFEQREFATASIAKPGPPEFTALLSSKPSGTITDVVGHYDAAGMAMAKTAKQQGRDDLMLWGYDGEREAVSALVSGNPPFGGTAGIPFAYMTWAAVDLLARKKAGVELWSGATDMPVQLIEKGNAAQFNDPYSDPAPEGDWRAAFREQWTAGS